MISLATLMVNLKHTNNHTRNASWNTVSFKYTDIYYTLFYLVYSKANISQGSVATRLGCGGIFNDRFVANFYGIYVGKKKTLKYAIFDAVTTKENLGGLLFIGPLCRHVATKVSTLFQKKNSSLCLHLNLANMANNNEF